MSDTTRMTTVTSTGDELHFGVWTAMRILAQ